MIQAVSCATDKELYGEAVVKNLASLTKRTSDWLQRLGITHLGAGSLELA
jgi:hypothetical protein